MNPNTRLYLAWLTALIATLGSLYFSEIRHFLPCALCWYQRCLMYPLALILGVAALRNDLNIRPYAVTLAVTGACVAFIQNLEGWGIIHTLNVCRAGVPCDAKWPIFGAAYTQVSDVITIPLLSLLAFTLITGLLSWRHLPHKSA